MGDRRETLPAATIGGVVYTANVEVSCPPFTELVTRGGGRQVQAQACPDRPWAVRAYEAFLHQQRGRATA